MKPDFAVGCERDAARSAFDRNQLDDLVCFGVDHHDTLIFFVWVVQLPGFWLNRKNMSARQQQVDLLQRSAVLQIVDDQARNVCLLDTYIWVLTIFVEDLTTGRRA